MKDAIAHYPTVPFLGLRFTLALLVLAAIVHRLPSRRTLVVGAAVGTVLATGYLAQTLGLNFTSPGNAGLITGLFVVFTPLIDRLFGNQVHRRTAIAAMAALVGTVALSGIGSASVEPLGDGLEVVCAIAFALQIVLLSRWSTATDAGTLTLVQIAACALIFDVGSVGSFRVPHTSDVWVAIVITSVFASALAFFIQTWAQAHLTASRTALILATEPAWALFFGVSLAGQRLTLVEALGAVLVLAAILGHEVAGSVAERRLARGAHELAQ